MAAQATESQVTAAALYTTLSSSDQQQQQQRQLNLRHLVNLALSSSPKAGVVNFNLLKVFLLELLNALNLQTHEFTLDPNSETSATLIEAEKLSTLSGDSSSSSNQQPFVAVDPPGSSMDRMRFLEDKVGRLEMQLGALTNSMPTNQAIIEKSKMQQTPSTMSIGSNGSSGGGGGGNRPSGPILEIWQYTQISKRMESTEEGLSKLSSLLQDLINEMSELRERQEKNSNDIKRLDDLYGSLLERLSTLEKLKESMPSLDQIRNLENELEELRRKLAQLDLLDDKLKYLTDQIKSIETKIYQFVTHPDLDLYVTWPGLENCLKGLREALDSVKQRESELTATPRFIPPPLEQRFTQTTPIPPIQQSPEPSQQHQHTQPPITPLPVPPQPQVLQQPPETKYIKETIYVTRPASSSSGQPTKDLQEILSKLGTLNERHELLRELVEKLRDELNKKMDKSQISIPAPTTTQIPSQPPLPQISPSFKLPDDFGQKMDEIKRIISTLEELKNNFGIETNKRLELEKMIANLNNELENIKEALKECLKNTQLNKNDILDLKEAIKLLEETKADKDWVQGEFERKADKRELDLKLNKKTFDDTYNEVSNSLNGCIQKHSCLEEDWKKGNEKIFKELESKLDRLELNSLKDYIEKQLRKLKKLQKEGMAPIQALPAINAEDDAAGLRKPLLRFHCLSCDRPIEMPNQSVPLPSLPAERGMRPIQTPRPYQTFELDQIRQFQKQQLMQDPLGTSYDLFATVRQCGGPHTLTIPQKKLYKIAQPVGVVEEVTYPTSASIVNHTTHKSEVQLQGQDGHIYKGRIDARLSVEMKRKIKNGNNTSLAYQQRLNQVGSAHATNGGGHSHSHNGNLNQATSVSYTNLRSAVENENNNGNNSEDPDRVEIDESQQNESKLPVITN